MRLFSPEHGYRSESSDQTVSGMQSYISEVPLWYVSDLRDKVWPYSLLPFHLT